MIQINALRLDGGIGKSFEIGREEWTFGFDSHSEGNDKSTQSLRQHKTKYALLVIYDGHNVIVANRGRLYPVYLDATELAVGVPHVWLEHQTIQIADRYVLTWAPKGSSRESAPVTSTVLAPTASTSVLRQRSANLRRISSLQSIRSPIRTGQVRFTKPAERISRTLLTLFLVAILTLFSALMIVYSMTQANILKTPTPPPTVTATPSATPTATAGPTLTATPTITRNPTDVRVENAQDKASIESTPIFAAGGSAATPIPCQLSTLEPEIWEEVLDELGVRFAPACVLPGQSYWRLIEAKWLSEKQSNGFHHIFVDMRDGAGQRDLSASFIMSWTTGQCERQMQSESGPWGYGAHCPMYAAGQVYTVQGTDSPSDKVLGVGLGSPKQRDWAILTSYQFIFQRTTFNSE